MGKADPKHPKGKQYSERELKAHRDNWYKKIENSQITQWDNHNYDSDKELFRRICNLFTSDVVRWLSKTDLSGSHPYEVFEPFFEFLEIKNDPFNEFINVEMEKLRGSLLSAIKEFINYKATNTFVKEIAGRNRCVTRQWMTNHEDWTPQSLSYDEYTAQFEKEADTLNDLATAVWESYCILVRQKKLFVAVEGESIEAAVRLAATYGLRRSEALGLMWSAVDFKKKTVRIQHTVVRDGKQVI